MGSYDDKQGPGRPKKLSNKISEGIVNDFKSKKLQYLSDGYYKVKKENNISVSRWTIRRSLKSAGIKCYKKQKKCDLSKKHINSRFLFSEKFSSYNYQDWNKVIWSDESTFQLRSSSNVEYYWCDKADPLNEKNIKKTKKFGGGSLMIWGCITAQGTGELLRINEKIDSKIYTKILQDGLYPTLDMHNIDLKNTTFMHDNALVHISKFTN